MADKTKITTHPGDEGFDKVAAVIGQVAHDFNNLLTPLVAYPELIRRDLPEGSTASSLIDVIEKTARDMAHLTRQLLLLASHGSPDRGVVDVNAVARDVLQEWSAAGERWRVSIDSQLADSLSPVRGREEVVKTVLQNLVANALEGMGMTGNAPSDPIATLPGGVLTVRTESLVLAEKRTGVFGAQIDEGEVVRVTVQDTGSGIPADLQSGVFDLFSTTRKKSDRRGAGLGLSVVLKIVNGLGGIVNMTSEEGKGTTVTLLLPVGAEQAERPKKDPVCAPPPVRDDGESASCGATILIVDDEQSILRLFSMLLSHALPTAHIEVASNGAEGVSKFKEFRPDVILMDLHMPVMDGQAAFHQIRETCAARHWDEPSVVFCTGFAPPDSLRHIIADDPRHCLLSKPVKSEVLVEHIKTRLISGRR